MKKKAKKKDGVASRSSLVEKPRRARRLEVSKLVGEIIAGLIQRGTILGEKDVTERIHSVSESIRSVKEDIQRQIGLGVSHGLENYVSRSALGTMIEEAVSSAAAVEARDNRRSATYTVSLPTVRASMGKDFIHALRRGIEAIAGVLPSEAYVTDNGAQICMTWRLDTNDCESRRAFDLLCSRLDYLPHFVNDSCFNIGPPVGREEEEEDDREEPMSTESEVRAAASKLGLHIS